MELSEENKNKLKISLEILNDIHLAANSALKKIESPEFSPLEFITINFLDRFSTNIISLNVLLSKFEENYKLETSIGLLIRTSLYDFMTLAYLMSYVYDSRKYKTELAENILYEQIERLFCDHIKFSINYLKIVYEKKILTDKNYKLAIDNIRKDYYFVFKSISGNYYNAEKDLKQTKTISSKELFNRLITHEIGKSNAAAYDLYNYYSKYEHFGIMTHYLQQQGINNDFRNIVLSLKFVLNGIGICVSYFALNGFELTKETDMLKSRIGKYEKLVL